MEYRFKLLIVAFGLLFFHQSGHSQTCCSGGVPLSGNIGFDGSERGTLQMELSYDLNYLATLKNGADIYQDETRRRTTQSLLFKTGYSISERWAVDGLFTYVKQGRRITYSGQVNQVQTSGIGDAVVILKYVLSSLADTGTEFQLGAGPKIPFGRSDLMDERGITLNADLQPGSGSWDLITWGYVARQIKRRPSATISGRIVGRFNGVNPEYLGSQTYQFGHSFQVYLGFGEQMNIGTQIISASLFFRYRQAFPDRVSSQVLDNTGGQWLNIIPSIGWHLKSNTILQIVPEIPLYGKVEGIQLSPTFRLQFGLYHTIGRKKKVEPNDFQL